jgi:hypothetical protein
MFGGNKLCLAGLACALLLSACDLGDLTPSGRDKRQAVVAGSLGYLPTQRPADFTLSDTGGNDFNLAQQLSGGATPADAVVLYFTMWCPICLGHSDHMIYAVIPRFKNRGSVRYVLVDYVSGSVSQSYYAEAANGYVGSDFTVLADSQQAVFHQFHAAMGSVVVIDGNGIIRLNEDYRDGSRLAETLDGILP